MKGRTGVFQLSATCPIAVNAEYTLLDMIREYPPVLTKRDFYRRFEAGEFGNKGPNWDSLAAWKAAKHTGLTAIRCKRVGGRCDYNIPPGEVEARMRDFERQGYKQEELNWSAMAPHHRQTLQGYVRQSDTHLDFDYSMVPKAMRISLAEGEQHASGLLATSLLRTYLCANSYEWLMILFERYPDHVVEFTCFEGDWGDLPGFNTVFWEVRRYMFPFLATCLAWILNAASIVA